MKNFPDLTVIEVAKLGHDKTVTARTVNDKIGIMGRFFRWAINQGYIETNYAGGKRLPKGKPQYSTHEPWTIEDIQKMLNAPQYVKDSFRSPYQFWMVPLALYTGARQSELAQLRCEDLYETDGLWCIRIHPNTEDVSSRVKTINAIRTVPLHPVLVEELKFPAFVERVRNKGHSRIFPEIKPRQGKYGKVVSQWFNGRFKKKLDLQPPRAGLKKDFHSFRNVFINAAKQARVPMDMIEETVGHAIALGNRQQSMSGDYYASDYSERIRYEELMLKVDYDIDIHHLKDSRHGA
jgi:integrase